MTHSNDDVSLYRRKEEPSVRNTEVATVPASVPGYQNIAFHGPAGTSNPAGDPQPSTSGLPGPVDTYESLPDDEGRIQHGYEILRPNRPLINRARNSLMPT